MAAWQIVTNLVRWLVTLPAASTGVRAGIARNRDAMVPGVVIPSAVDNMSPRHHFIRALQEIPVAPSITAHSIIAVQGEGPIQQGNDGVVEYASAHIDGVESEARRAAVEPLHSRQSADHRGGAPHPPPPRAPDRLVIA